MYNSEFFEAVEYKNAKKLYEILPKITVKQLSMKNNSLYENDGLTAPEIAVRIDHQEILCALIEHGIGLGVKANFFDTAVIRTVIDNKIDSFHLLMDDSSLQFTSWYLLNDVVRSKCSLDTFRILLAHDVGLNIPPKDLGTLVKEAAIAGNANALRPC